MTGQKGEHLMERYFAVHMKNDKTGEERIQKISAENVDEATLKSNCGYGTGWSWIGSGPFSNMEEKVERIGRGYYKKKEVKEYEY